MNFPTTDDERPPDVRRKTETWSRFESRLITRGARIRVPVRLHSSHEPPSRGACNVFVNSDIRQAARYRCDAAAARNSSSQMATLRNLISRISFTLSDIVRICGFPLSQRIETQFFPCVWAGRGECFSILLHCYIIAAQKFEIICGHLLFQGYRGNWGCEGSGII